MPYLIASFPTGSFPTNTWPDFTWPEGSVSVDIQYTEVMAFAVKAFVTAALSVELPNETSIDVDVMGEVVSGAGSTAVNGGYELVGESQWKKTDADIYIIGALGYWLIFSDTAQYYVAVSDAATPDLVTNWTVNTDGAPPLPTIAVGVVGTTPVLSALVSLTVESPQLISLTVYQELSK